MDGTTMSRLHSRSKKAILMSRGRRLRGLALPPLLAAVLGGCSSSGSGYVNPNVDFGHIRRVAVLPFENLTPDDLADERMHSVFLMELLEEDVLEVADPGETVAAMRSLGLPVGSALSPDQAVKLGAELRVEALIAGTIEEYGLSRVDRSRGPEVTAVFAMIETETGSMIWRSQVYANGASTLKKLFGGGASGMYEVSREAVRKALGTLL